MPDFNLMGDRPQNSAANFQNLGLLGSGWRPLYRELNWDYLGHLLVHDTQEVMQKATNAFSEFVNVLGRNQYTWWANLTHLFSQDARYEFDRLWEYITPDPTYPDQRYQETLSAQVPVTPLQSQDGLPVDYALHRLRETIINQILEFLGCPDLIVQYYLDRHFYLPPNQFKGWDRLVVLTSVQAYWAEQDVWLRIDRLPEKGRSLTLLSKDLQPLISKAAYGLTVMLSGYQCRIGQIHSDYAIRTFPRDVQNFTDAVQQAVFDQSRLAVLVSGKPGTGKTAWTQAIAREVLAPLGYVIFILDHDAVEHFVPPAYLERVCLIINEADNLAHNRASDAAQRNGRTERILSLLDGTLYRSVIDPGASLPQQRFVVLMTCNTTDRLDPAILRKGRIDLTCEFTHCFVE